VGCTPFDRCGRIRVVDEPIAASTRQRSGEGPLMCADDQTHQLHPAFVSIKVEVRHFENEQSQRAGQNDVIDSSLASMAHAICCRLHQGLQYE
jgi:hypothetical protein